MSLWQGMMRFNRVCFFLFCPQSILRKLHPLENEKFIKRQMLHTDSLPWKDKSPSFIVIGVQMKIQLLKGNEY